MGKNKKTEQISEINVAKRILVYVFLFAFLGVYPIITNDKYFDITKTRYTFFMVTTAIFVISFLVLCIVGSFHPTYDKNKANIVYKKEKPYKRPELWMEAFALANVYSCTISVAQVEEPYSNPSILGENGRYMGMVTYIVIGVMFLVLAYNVKLDERIFWVLVASSAYAYIIAIFQHVGMDFMGYKERLAPKLNNVFMSTFGNINIFASFLSMCIPMFLCLFIFSDKRWKKIILGIMLVMSGMVLMIANSDSGYLGVGAGLILVFFIAFINCRTLEFGQTVVCLVVGTALQAMINRLCIDFKNNRGGVSSALDDIQLVIFMCIFVIASYGIMQLTYKRLKEKNRSILPNRKKAAVIIGIGMLVVAGIVVVVGVNLQWSIFTFDKKWGNYRGMIWKICGELFNDAPSLNKLFGYGNETLKMLTVNGYYDIMIENTNRIYDNAHNEVLHYLVTLGIVGAVSYVGLFISSFAYIVANTGRKLVPYICLAGMTGYFVQGLVNIAQPITTPFFFLIMALGIGYVRQVKEGDSF